MFDALTVMAANLTLGEAWRNWGTFSDTGSVYLWGRSIQWWGRFGAILQGVAGVGAILDIVGEEGFGKLWKVVSSPVKSDNIHVAIDRTVMLGCALWIVGIGGPLGFFLVVAFKTLALWEATKGAALLVVPFCVFGLLFLDIFVILAQDLFYKNPRHNTGRRRYFTLHRTLRLMFFFLFLVGCHFSILAL